jgi:uncharacterized protein
MNQPLLPKNVKKIEKEEGFCFSCHPAIPCFTDCCRQLELALTPYDVLRLKKACGLHSKEFLDRYVIIEQEDYETFPRFYLTMVDDGRESCVFVAESGCTVYKDRPGACRAYPLGRAAIRQPDDSVEGFFVLLQEAHCRGFEEQQGQTPAIYSEAQELADYNRLNDAMTAILQHDQIRKGMKFSADQIDQFILALYNLDQFRRVLFAGDLPKATPLDESTRLRLEDDEKLLFYAIDWLQALLFKTKTST